MAGRSEAVESRGDSIEFFEENFFVGSESGRFLE
jgi:hypothetical protein